MKLFFALLPPFVIPERSKGVIAAIAAQRKGRHDAVLLTSKLGRRTMKAKALLKSIVVVASILGTTAPAMAALINLPAIAFATRDPIGGGTSDHGEPVKGMLGNAGGVYFASVLFPSAGNVCAVHLVLRDFEVTANVTARLLRKGFSVGAFALADPLVMASVSSLGGISTNFQRFTDNTIVAPTVVPAAFYFVELSVPADTLEVLGVQIDFRTTACP